MKDCARAKDMVNTQTTYQWSEHTNIHKKISNDPIRNNFPNDPIYF